MPLPDFSFPPVPSSDHLKLERPPTSPGQVPEPAPPIPHATPYMDIVNLRKARRISNPTSASPERKIVHFPWGRDTRPQDGIASGIATTLGFGAAAAPNGTVDTFMLINNDSKSLPKK
ncbi:hypothetical protein CTheo_5808 [Ceratobasidium theobromae]|uniref:Uncharacterized protein n=1 Tax=Ceratobasidium theobromae TaxID=1582974 RepID=A0A5N5QG82_9AGAM|nr:hypothetical protein CTheo_5808 [Ceratobasidium theobromae]